MKRLQKTAKRLTAGLLCATVTYSCFSGLNLTAFAAESEGNDYEPIRTEVSDILDSQAEDTSVEVSGKESVNTGTIPPATDLTGPADINY